MTSTDDPLVSTDWLAAHIDDPKVKVIDASFKLPGVLPLPVDDYLAAHIPGAVFFDVDAISDHNDPRPHMYPDADAVRARHRSARHFHRRYRGGLRFRRLGRRAASVVDVPVVRLSQREGAGRRSEEMDAAKAARPIPARSRRSPESSRPNSIPATSAASSKCSAISRRAPSSWSMRVRVGVSKVPSRSRGRNRVPAISPAAATCPTPNCSTPRPAR